MPRMGAPREIHAAAAAGLGARTEGRAQRASKGALGLDGLRGPADLSPERRQTFAVRLDRYWPDLEAAVRELHPDPDTADDLLARLVRTAATAYAERPADLHLLDQRRLLPPDWLQQPRMFGYSCYTERFAGDLLGVPKHLDHLEDLGVTYLHLMPLLLPRAGTTTAATPCRTTARSGPTSAPSRTSATWPRRCAAGGQPGHGTWGQTTWPA